MLGLPELTLLPLLPLPDPEWLMDEPELLDPFCDECVAGADGR